MKTTDSDTQALHHRVHRSARTALVGALFAASAIGTAAAQAEERPRTPGSDIQLEDLRAERDEKRQAGTTQTYSLGDFRGRYIVLHFGTSW